MSITYNTFSSGEISPILAARGDLQRYYTGLSRCENFIIMKQGGLTKRAGTTFCDNALSDAVRLIPFIFSETQSCVLAFGGGKLRLYWNGSRVVKVDEDGNKIDYEVDLPPEYTDSVLKDIRYCQNADVLFLVHPYIEPMTLSRYDHTDWRFNQYDMYRGPYEDINTDISVLMYALDDPRYEDNKDIILRCVNKDDSGNALFSKDIVDTYFCIELQDFSKLKPWVASSVVKVGDIRYSDFKIYECTEASGDHYTENKISYDENGEMVETESPKTTVTGANKPTHTEGEEWDGDGDLRNDYCYGAKWKYLHDGKIYGRIKSLASKTEKTVTEQAEDGTTKEVIKTNWTEVSEETETSEYAFARAYYHGRISELTGKDNASYKWAFGAFSPKNGYPSSVCFYQQRLTFAGTRAAPQTVWMSGLNDFDFFGLSSPSVESDALTFSLISNKINRIVGFVPLKALVALTEGSTFAVRSQEGGFSASTLAIEIQNHIGAGSVQPLIVNDSALFAQAKQSAIRDLAYSFQSDNYTGTELSVMAHHLFDGKQIIDWAYAQTPDSVVYIVLDDGSMVMMTYFKEHEVIGFSRFVTAGKIKSVCVIPDVSYKVTNDSEAENDYDALYMVVDRGGVTCIERLENRINTNVYLDCAVADGADIAVKSVLDPIKFAVKSVVLDDKSVVVGLSYTSKMTTLDIQSDQQPDLVTRRKSIHRAYIRSIGSSKYKVRSGNSLQSGGWAAKESDYYPTETEGERIREVNLSDRYGRSGRFSLIHEAPEALSILGVSLGIDVK